MKYILLVIFSTILLNSNAQLPANLPAQGLIGWYPFNGNSNDESGFANHAVAGTNVTLTNDRYNTPNSAYNFVGLSQLLIPPAPYTPFDSSFTISLWFRSTNNNRQQPININDGNLYTSNLNFAFNNSGGNFVFWNSQGSNNIVSGSVGEFTDGFWHNVIFLRDDSIVKIYFDGVLGGTKNYKLPIGNNSAISLSNGSYSWKGDLDDFAIYNRALTSAEIDSLNDLTNPDIVISTPTATDAFPVGYADTIRWINKFMINKVRIEYSLDGGNSYNLLKDSVASGLREYIWITPNLPGNTCIIKITDIADSTKYDLSAPFLISKYKWQSVTNSGPFSIRDGAGAYAFNDSMYLVGGWNPTDPNNYPLVTNNEVWRSHDGANWSLISTGPWEPRHTFGHLVYNNKMWILGGDELQYHWQKDVWNSSDGVNWTLLSDTVPWGERMTHLSCVYDNKMWVMGGQKIVGWSNVKDTAYNDVWSSTDGINWTQVTQHAGWSPRAQVQGEVVFDNKMWVLGGGTYNGVRKFYNDVWNTTDGINWNLVTANAPWAPRQYHEVAVFDSAIWVMDGYDAVNGNRNDVWYSYNGIDWHNLRGTPWPPRHAASVFNHDESLWMVAGNLWNDAWRLNNIACVPLSSQPLDTTLLTGDTATFSVSTTQNNVLFQWQIDSMGVWQNIVDSGQYAGANSNTLSINNLTLWNDSVFIRCIATKGLCSDTSAKAILQVDSGVGIAPINRKESTTMLYPNPTQQTLYVKSDKTDIGAIYYVFDCYGKLALSGRISNEVIAINTMPLSSGLYLMRIGEHFKKSFTVQR